MEGFLVLAAGVALPGCAGRFFAVRKSQMCVFGAESPLIQPPQGRSGRFRTRFSPVTASAAGQSSGSRSPEAAQAAACSPPAPGSGPWPSPGSVAWRGSWQCATTPRDARAPHVSRSRDIWRLFPPDGASASGGLVPTGSFIPKCRRFPFLVRGISGSAGVAPVPGRRRRPPSAGPVGQAIPISRTAGAPGRSGFRTAATVRAQRHRQRGCGCRPSHASAQCGPPGAPPDAQCRARISSCIQSFPGESSLRICSCDEGRTTGFVPLRQPQSCRRFGTRRDHALGFAG